MLTMASVIGGVSLLRVSLLLGWVWIANLSAVAGQCVDPGDVLSWQVVAGIDIQHSRKFSQTYRVPLADCKDICINAGSSCLSLDHNPVTLTCEIQGYTRETEGATQILSTSYEHYQWVCSDFVAAQLLRRRKRQASTTGRVENTTPARQRPTTPTRIPSTPSRFITPSRVPPTPSPVTTAAPLPPSISTPTRARPPTTPPEETPPEETKPAQTTPARPRTTPITPPSLITTPAEVTQAPATTKTPAKPPAPTTASTPAPTSEPTPEPSKTTTTTTTSTTTTTTTNKPGQKRIGIRFKLQGNYSAVVEGREEEFKDRITAKLANQLGVDPQRIQIYNIKPGSIIIEIILLPGGDNEPTVNEATKDLDETIAEEKFAMEMDDGTELTAEPTFFEIFEPGEEEGKEEEEEEDDSILYRLTHLRTEYYVLIGMALMILLLVVIAVAIICCLSGKK